MRYARLDTEEQRLYVCDLILLDLETDIDTDDFDLELLQDKLDYILDVINSLPIAYDQLKEFLLIKETDGTKKLYIFKQACVDYLNGYYSTRTYHFNTMCFFKLLSWAE